MSKKKRISRILAIFLAASMVLSYNSGFYLSVWAAGEDTPAAEEEMMADPAPAEDSEAAEAIGETEVTEEADGTIEEDKVLIEEPAPKTLKSVKKAASNSGGVVDDASAVNFTRILGRAVEYGILADTFDQQNHAQTNFAVKTYKRGEYNNDPDLAGSHIVPFIVGNIASSL